MRVYPASLGPATGGTYTYQYDWIFIRQEVLGNKRRLVLISHELGHATLGHRPIDDARRATEGVERERDANRRGVEIMVKFLGLTEREDALRTNGAGVRDLHGNRDIEMTSTTSTPSRSGRSARARPRRARA